MRPNAAAQRYLLDQPADERLAKAHLVRVARDAADLLAGINLKESAVTVTTWLSQFEGSACNGARDHERPTLTEFAREYGLEDESEAEIQRCYSEQFREEIAAEEEGRDTSTLSPVPVLAVLTAIREVQARGVVAPSLSDPLRTWFSASLCRRLDVIELRTVGALHAFVGTYGPHWFRRVPGIGCSRGQRITTWLDDHQEALGTSKVDSGALAPASPADAGRGVLQTTGTNALGAYSDREALQSWMATLDFLSPHTKRAYGRDVQRLLAWAHIELGKKLSDLTVSDAVAHARFLQDPPQRWIALPGQTPPAPGITMRGALAPSSAARTLAAIGHFYGFLVETGYLSANPFARIRAPHDRGVHMDVQRCFSDAHVAAMKVTLQRMADSARKRRITAILSLLESTGLRVGEIPCSWDSVVSIMDSQAGAVQCLKVVGKGGRERLMPLRSDVLQALAAHAGDQVREHEGSKPLIGLIERPAVKVSQAATSALSTSRVRVVLKEFFVQVAGDPDCPEELQEDFRRATPHFMRHTFAHRVLEATGQDLAVTQQLLGHKSISTTGIYIKARIFERAQAVNALGGLSVFAARPGLAP